MVGALAFAGVVFSSFRAAKAAEAADRRTAEAAEAADRRHADAEQARWTREQRIAAYLEYLVCADAQAAQGRIVRVIMQSPSSATASDSEDLRRMNDCSRDSIQAFRRLTMIASREVVVAATRLSGVLSDMAKVVVVQPPATDAEVNAAGRDYEPAHQALLAAIRLELGVPA